MIGPGSDKNTQTDRQNTGYFYHHLKREIENQQLLGRNSWVKKGNLAQCQHLHDCPILNPPIVPIVKLPPFVKLSNFLIVQLDSLPFLKSSGAGDVLQWHHFGNLLVPRPMEGLRSKNIQNII